MYATDFIFDDVRASEQGFMICSFNGNDSETADSGSKIEFTTINPSGSNMWLKTNANYSEPLTFSFSICKHTCENTDNMLFNHEDIAFIMRWLVRKEYCYIHFLQDEFEDVYYNCRLQVEQHLVQGKTIGFNVTGTCDSPFGYSEEHELTLYDSNLTQQIYDDSDEIGETLPYMELTCTKNGTIEITKENGKNSRSVMSIANCIKNEKIIIGQDYQITSNQPHPNLSKDFNYIYFTFGNTFDNRITNVKITNCNMKLVWRAIRKGAC